MKSKNQATESSKISHYFSLIALAPSVLSVLAYEFVIFILHLIRGDVYSYNPIDGVAILIPMALLTELFTFFLSKAMAKKVTRISDAVKEVASGDYDFRMSSKHMAPFTDVVDNINKMVAELGSVETLRSNFIKDFSHEFKTPIVSIKGFADLLLSSELSPEVQKEYLEIIAEESSRLSHMSEQTLLMSKLDSQNILTGNDVFSLDELIRRNIILLSSLWEAKDIEMNINLAPMKFYGNKELMNHVFINIINNAIKYTGSHGTINVNGEQADDKLVVSISDNGIGIPSEKLDHIFTRFYQADESHSSEGLGLGLSIAAKIVSLSQGEIQVMSTEGLGSTFTIILPAIEK